MLDREKLVEAFENFRSKLIRLVIILGAVDCPGLLAGPLDR